MKMAGKRVDDVAARIAEAEGLKDVGALAQRLERIGKAIIERVKGIKGVYAMTIASGHGGMTILVYNIYATEISGELIAAAGDLEEEIEATHHISLDLGLGDPKRPIRKGDEYDNFGGCVIYFSNLPAENKEA